MKHKNKKLSSVKSILKLLQHLQVIHYGKAYVDVNYNKEYINIAYRKPCTEMGWQAFNRNNNDNATNYKKVLNSLNTKFNDSYGTEDNKSLKTVLKSVHKLQLKYYNIVRISITIYPTDTIEATVYSNLYSAKSFSFGHYSKDTYDNIYKGLTEYCEYVINNDDNETSNS